MTAGPVPRLVNVRERVTGVPTGVVGVCTPAVVSSTSPTSELVAGSLKRTSATVVPTASLEPLRQGRVTVIDSREIIPFAQPMSRITALPLAAEQAPRLSTRMSAAPPPEVGTA